MTPFITKIHQILVEAEKTNTIVKYVACNQKTFNSLSKEFEDLYDQTIGDDINDIVEFIAVGSIEVEIFDDLSDSEFRVNHVVLSSLN